jgi:hypothetical protein
MDKQIMEIEGIYLLALAGELGHFDDSLIKTTY